jgi:hypothetical protein
MALFSRETNEAASSFLLYIHDSLSDSCNLFWYHIVAWGCMLVGTSYMMMFGVIGLNTWWSQYSARNPNVVIETTIHYWIFMISSTLLQIALVLQTLLVFGLLFALIVRRTSLCRIRSTDLSTINPLCPTCNSNYSVIKKGMRKNKRRYMCKECGKYFTDYGDQ